jgi:transposase
MPNSTARQDPLSLEFTPAVTSPKRRFPRGVPRFLVDQSHQLDPFHGSPALQVPAEHEAWSVLRDVEALDTTALEEKCSRLGRHGFHPKHVLGVWLLGSIQGVHHATKLAERTRTDAAYRLVSGGRAISATTFKDFRRENLAFLENAVQQTVLLAVERGLIDPQQLAVDSARLQADTSTKSVRTLSRSKKRLEQLSKAGAATMTEEERATHQAKVRKHEEAVRRCEAEGRTSHSVTDAHAGLMKFPDGAALPGHRVTVTSAGTDVRFVVSVLINAAPNDFGMLEQATREAHDALIAAGMPVREGAPRMQVAADPGYLSERDLTFVYENQSWVDVLIHEPASGRAKNAEGEEYFGREAFHIHDNGEATCPAGRKMKGPYKNGESRLWHGVGCEGCPLRAQCTKGKRRALTQNPHLDLVRGHMSERMAEPGAKQRYNKRIATVEPVFSYIEDAMGFRRASSRKTETVKAEILLKVLAYNLLRLRAAKSVVACSFAGVYSGSRFRPLVSWMPILSTISSAPDFVRLIAMTRTA